MNERYERILGDLVYQLTRKVDLPPEVIHYLVKTHRYRRPKLLVSIRGRTAMTATYRHWEYNFKVKFFRGRRVIKVMDIPHVSVGSLLVYDELAALLAEHDGETFTR